MTTPPSMKIVVARYKENIEWAREYDNNVIVYNKGPKLDDEYHEISLDNVGREGHTYYQYICDHYDTLDDYTIFLQGYPFDHSPDILAQLAEIHQKLLCNELASMEFKFLTTSNLIEPVTNTSLPMIRVYEYLFENPIDISSVPFGAGAQFIVSKARILQRPRHFYERIVDLLKHDVCPIEGYVIERFHSLIFAPSSPP
jgi:hypothetical protein